MAKWMQGGHKRVLRQRPRIGAENRGGQTCVCWEPIRKSDCDEDRMRDTCATTEALERGRVMHSKGVSVSEGVLWKL